MALDRTRYVRRRLLQGGLALAGLGFLSSCGFPLPFQDQPKLPRRGYLVATSELASPHQAFLDGLRDLGYIDGQTIRIDYRFAGGAVARYPELEAELVQLGPDVIAVGGMPAAQAARAATTTIPLVYVGGNDPVEYGMAARLAHPGGNVTGLVLSPLGADLGSKRLDLLRQVVPGLSRVAVLRDESGGGVIAAMQAERAAQPLGLHIRVLQVGTEEEIDAAFQTATRDGVQSLLVPLTLLTLQHRAQIVRLAAKAQVPAMFDARPFMDAGGLIAYGTSQEDVHRRAATYVDKILRGARPGDLPIEQPTKFDLIVNLKTAQALGLTIPQAVLQQATEIIQ